MYHPTNQQSGLVAELSPATKKKYLTPEGAFIDQLTVVIDEQIICSVDDIALVGEHNLENVCAAVTAAWQFTKDTAAISQAVKNFKGLEHRLEFVRQVGGVSFYNDSFSSMPGAALAAMKAFDQPEIVIMGGYDKHASFDELAREMSSISNIKKILLIGQTKELIAESLRKSHIKQFEVLTTTNFKEIIELAFNVATEGDVVLLTPACSSFDMFKSFYDRGTQFKEIVRKFDE